ncbi:MAG: hypothetical protein WB511_15080 [Nitrososphaeraceae archaeon]
MSIQDINIAVGLKDALLDVGITLEKIIDYVAEEIALILGIDKYVATLIKKEAVNTRTEILNSTLLLA